MVQVLQELIKGRKIALLGAKTDCIGICTQLRDQPLFEIKYFVNTKGIEPFHLNEGMDWLEEGSGLQSISIKELQERDDIFLVVCNTENVFWADELLYKKGLILMEDYVDGLYIIQMLYKEYPLDIRSKDVWIFGAGYQGKAFYERCKEYLNITGFISNDLEQKQCCGKPVIRPAEYSRNCKNYIIICYDYAEEMGELLNNMGLFAFRHWAVRQAYPKKLFVSLGICQERDVSIALSEFPEFTVRYRVLRLTESFTGYMHYNARARLLIYGACCDVVFYGVANTWTKLDISYEKIIERKYKGAYQIRMPQYHFMGQQPQAIKFVHKYAIKANCDIWFRGDVEVNQMLEQGEAKEAILNNISREDYWTEEFISKNLQMEFKKIEILDRISTVKMLPIIKREYKNRILFRDGVHFSAWLEVQLASQIAGLIGIAPLSSEEERVLQQGMKKDSFIPPYPCVSKWLGLDHKQTWSFLHIDGSQESLSFEELMSRYIDYIQAVREIYESNGAALF